jgi:mono/diheme cytochrome c family protein
MAGISNSMNLAQKGLYTDLQTIEPAGRPEKGMPPLRGTVTEDQIARIYQYLKARSNSLLPDGSE